MAERDTECRWTHWAIEYRNGEFNMVDWSTMRGTRAEAWKAWEADTELSSAERQIAEYKLRRAGRYRAVKVAAHKYVEGVHHG